MIGKLRVSSSAAAILEIILQYSAFDKNYAKHFCYYKSKHSFTIYSGSLLDRAMEFKLL